MRIQLSNDRRERLRRELQTFFDEQFDRNLSDFQADELVSFFVRMLGPSIYNQGVQDAAAFVQSKLEDLEGEVYERDSG